MKRVRVSHAASRDLDSIWLHVATQSGNVVVADKLIDAITRSIALLGRFPFAGRDRDEIHPGIRSFPAQSYLIYYSVTPRTLDINRVLHGMRDQETVYFDYSDPAI
jgi:toxin ParE1/3/4